jgi:hypothetical protein
MESSGTRPAGSSARTRLQGVNCEVPNSGNPLRCTMATMSFTAKINELVKIIKNTDFAKSGRTLAK